MLRRVASQQARRLATSTALGSKTNPSAGSRRLYAATSREKRALQDSQLKGSDAPKPPAGGEAPPAAAGGGGGISFPAVLAVVGVAGAGIAYSQGLIPGLSPHPEEVEEQQAEAANQSEESSAESEAPKSQGGVVSKDVSEDSSADVQEEAPIAPNKVTTITLPEGSERSAPPASVEDHPVGGNKVLMEPVNPVTENAPTVDKALDELQSQLSQETSVALKEAHKELAKLSSLDAAELDGMTETQLKIRLVQLAKDLEDRTKWEAVRLKEFLAMKEKEVEDK